MRDEILEELTHFDKSRMFTDRLFSIIGKMPLTSLFTLLPTHTGTVVYDSTVCITCRSVTDALLTYSQNRSPEDLRDLVYSICINLGIQTEEVCAGVIDLNMVIKIYLNICNTEECYPLDATLYSLVQVHKLFGEMYCIHIQCGRVNQAGDNLQGEFAACLAYSSTLKIEAIRFPEMLVNV
jgi:hypothetical protein